MATPAENGCCCCCSETAGSPRRGFLAAAVALGIGGLAFLSPLAAGIIPFLDPLWRKSKAGKLVRLALFENLPEDGTPQKVVVLADRTDAWNHFPDEPVGAVFLRRSGSRNVLALQATCPHSGCLVGYDTSAKEFLCPCHQAHFDLDGKRKDAVSPSPRDLDALENEVREGNEVWVKFQNFRTGTPAQVAKG
jgi:Rieske Fe-S protein